MNPRSDLWTAACPEGLEVFQLTTEEMVPSSHIYMEAQIFTPSYGDSAYIWLAKCTVA